MIVQYPIHKDSKLMYHKQECYVTKVSNGYAYLVFKGYGYVSSKMDGWYHMGKLLKDPGVKFTS